MSNVKVEQINLVGNIVEDYAEILNQAELSRIVENTFRCNSVEAGTAYGEYKGKKYCILYKNISYLGIPHPIYKKRIQIPTSFIKKYNENLSKGISTFFIGVYKYKENEIFVNFDTEKYIKNKAHNSSAHVLTIDLARATTDGVFFKEDIRKNKIFCFNSNGVGAFFTMYLLKSEDLTPAMYKIFNNFFDDINHLWNGIDCYSEMMSANYHRSKQPEWPGSYLEYLFEHYLQTHTDFIKGFVKYSPDRSSDGIDLDLVFPTLQERGDLKAHSNNSSAIPGNRTLTIQDCIKNGKSVYYIVFNHDTEKDKDHNYVVTKYWNTALGKLDNLRSYSSKMKYSVHLTSYMIIEINKKNYHYLNDSFQKGFINSDGKCRTSKISINKMELPNFIIHEYSGK